MAAAPPPTAAAAAPVTAGATENFNVRRTSHGFIESRRRRLRRRPGPLEELEKTLDATSSQVNEERIHFFFDALGDMPPRSRRAYSANLATAIMMPNPFAPDTPSDLVEHCTRVKQRSQEEIIFFARLAFSLPNEGWLTKECKDLAAFYDYIQEFPASDAERFRILGIVRNFNQYADELAEMLKPVVTAIVSSASVYTPLLERFAEAYQEKQPEEFKVEAAVITVSPGATAVTTPSSSTVAIAGSAEVQVTVRSVAVQGCTAAVRVLLEPWSMVRVWAEI